MAALVNALQKPTRGIDERRGEPYLTRGAKEVRLAARQAMKRSRHAIEDAMDDVAHTIKHYPMRAAGLAFGTGVLLGVTLFRAIRK
jgi:hypothetical protein